MPNAFLTAEWRKLIMANYAVDENLLQPYLPSGTELDLYEGRCYVSLVAFLFQNTRLKSIPIPFHRTFEEINLRFYVTHTTANDERRRGVVFIREFVPRFALTVVARSFYGEKYATASTAHQWIHTGERQSVRYTWRYQAFENAMQVEASPQARPIEPASTEEFFTEHYWGYTNRREGTSEYEVRHPRWTTYPIQQYAIDVNFGWLYGNAFIPLTGRAPESVLLAEGSDIEVHFGKRIPRLNTPYSYTK